MVSLVFKLTVTEPIETLVDTNKDKVSECLINNVKYFNDYLYASKQDAAVLASLQDLNEEFDEVTLFFSISICPKKSFK
jgi:hypothetical protein